jgi:ATP-dependent protease HslVU (ClpYQ) peptidase subunit
MGKPVSRTFTVLALPSGNAASRPGAAATAVLIQNTKETRRIAQRYTQIANELDSYSKLRARNKK